ncbi:fluoride efflux transporter CrcB [Roseovarius sp. SCSIO 43702]|uniref:fluoride efflux transporter CrcB n=1 Tax=Roseovarius sp. SCSIO 43702 TaxID=2823043 RepID=UPI001C72BF1B|nr:fluoride efflux transporter CrcB [Roseovarius sp. SCSIO 43702]QYX56738.1 fluoride efflux transporter CrcB [Roseovarius sp. SCSIO 43702]
MIMSFLQVALGGAIGAALRYGAGLALVRHVQSGFPVAILSVNVLGSFLMGLFVVWSVLRGVAHWNLFVMTGILGGFTTFSAFSLEAVMLLERGHWGSALLYIGLSVILSIAALAAGAALARGVWA